jgi:hypothetical protein
MTESQVALLAVKYNYLFPVADDDGKTSSEELGDISDLLRAAEPYLFGSGLIPPLNVVNNLLATGSSDHGMGGGAEWEPFALSDEGFDAFVRYLNSPAGRRKFHNEKPVVVAHTPVEVQTAEDFQDWKIDEALKDPAHHLNSPERNCSLNGRLVTFREYWQDSKRAKKERRGEGL